jgi:hypothetical protein
MVTNQSTVSAVDVQPLISETDPRRSAILPGEREARVQRLADI